MILRVASLFAVLLVLAEGCSSSTEPSGANEAVSNLRVADDEATSTYGRINVIWDRKSDDVGIDSAFLTGDGTPQATATIYPYGNTYFTKLKYGTIYTITIKANGKTSSMKWATGMVSRDQWLAEVRPSGENTALTLEGGGHLVDWYSNKQSADVLLMTSQNRIADTVMLLAPSAPAANAPGGRQTVFGPGIFIDGNPGSNGITLWWRDADLSKLVGTPTTSFNAVMIPTDAHPNKHLVFPLITADGHYGAISIAPQPNGKYFTYYDVESKYRVEFCSAWQPVANLPYAARPRPSITGMKIWRAN
jgi:hypothetical protein